jgi:hypothetical protein
MWKFKGRKQTEVPLIDPRRSGPIPDGTAAVDGRNTPLAFGPSDPQFGDHVIDEFNKLGRRLRGEEKEGSE